jgi:tRNA G37 N-methylase Trm5
VKAARPRFAVVVDKAGRVVVFSSDLDKAAADLLVVQLARNGCAARTVPALDTDIPGMQRRRKVSSASVR